MNGSANANTCISTSVSKSTGMNSDTPVSVPAATNLCLHLTQAALARGEDAAVIRQKTDGSYEQLTLAELDSLSDRIALAVQGYGIQAGQKAVLMVTPGLEFFALTFALFKAGIIPVMVDPGMGVKNLKACLAKAAPQAFIGIPKAQLARRLLGWGKATVKRVVTVGHTNISRLLWGGPSLDELLAAVPEGAKFDTRLLSGQELCAILFTSGSTGEPKGVEYSHSMFNAQIRALKEDYGIEGGEVDLSTFPLFALFGPALGMTSVIPDMDASKPITANPHKLLSAISQNQCTNLFLNPALLAKLANTPVSASERQAVKHQLASVRRVISAGAPADVGQIAKLCELLGEGVEVLNSYGATEALPVSMLGSNELIATREKTDMGAGICVGYPVGAEIKIAAISQTSGGQTASRQSAVDWLPAGEIGEILVKGEIASRRYYRNESATDKAKLMEAGAGTDAETSLSPSGTANFWHRMGDVGYLDEQGRLWMCGRLGHAVVSNKKWYFSLPCERVFNTHTQVKRSAIVPLQIDSDTQPVLCVELEKGANAEQVFAELAVLAQHQAHTQGITRFIQHAGFPMDVRHNAKIFREKLAVWTQKHAARIYQA